MTDYFDLGGYSRTASSEPKAQKWFDRGIVWLFAYNHEEAIVCFQKVLLVDPFCAAVNGRVKVSQRAAQNVATLGLG